MISWLQKFTQKHHKWLFSILLVVIIVSFVFVIGNTGQGYSGGNPSQNTKFYGYDLGRNSRDIDNFSRWTSISLELDGQRNSPGTQMLDRMVALHVADSLNIPVPTAKQVEAYIMTKRAFINPASGKFSSDEYEKFLDNLSANPNRGMDEDTVMLVIAQDYRIDQVNSILGGPGYVLPYQAEERIKQNNTVWSVEVASYSSDEFEPEISDDPAAVKTYFEENIENYRIGEKVSLSYVKFASETFVKGITLLPSDGDLQVTYTRNKHKYVKDDVAKTPKTFLEAKDEVLEDWSSERRKTLGSEKAGAAANQFSLDIYNGVYDKTLSKDSPALAQLIADQGLESIEIPPFNAQSIGGIAAQTGISFAALREAMLMDDNQFYSSPYELQNNQDGAVVLFFNHRIDSHLPDFETVETQVAEDFKQAEKQRLFMEACEAKRTQISEALAADEAFKDKAEALGMTVQTFEDFKASPPPQGLDRAIITKIADLQQGDLSAVIETGNTGNIVRILKKEEPNMDEKADEIADMLNSISTYTVMSSQRGVFNELIQKGMPQDETDEVENES